MPLHFVLTFVTLICSARADILFSEISKSDATKIKSQFGEEILPHEADELIRELMEGKRYEQVQVLRQGKDTLIQGRPLKKLASVRIRGNKLVPTSVIEGTMDLQTGQMQDRKSIVEAGQRLDEKYFELGYLNAKIEILFNEARDDSEEIVFDIEEGAPCQIDQINFSTENKVLRQRLAAHLRRQIGSACNLENISRLEKEIAAYLKSNRFLRARWELIAREHVSNNTRAWLTYKIEEPDQYEIIISGNSALTLPEIFRAIKLDDFERESLDPAGDISRRLKEKYLSLGYAHFKSDFKIRQGRGAFSKELLGHLEEGPLVRILEYRFSGSTTLPQSYYHNFIKGNSGELVRQGIYNREELSKSLKSLEIDLRNKGFLKAMIKGERTEFVRRKSAAIVHVEIFEGPLTQVRKISFSGAQKYSTLELTAALGIKSNSPLRLNGLEESIEKLKAFYTSRGHLEMKLLNEQSSLIEYIGEGTQANLNFEIYEGPQIHAGQIVIEGNSFTKAYVIHHELEFKVGDILTPELIEESTARLNNLGLFTRVEIRVLGAGGPQSRRTVVVSLGERKPGLFNTGFGVSSEREITARGFMGASYRNIGGTARAVTSRVEVSQNLKDVNYLQNRITAGYLEPYLFNTRTRGRSNITHSESVFAIDEAENVATIRRSDRIDFLLERDITSHIKLIWTLWSLDFVKEFQEPRELPEFEATGTKQIATIGPTLDLNYTNDPINPTRGNRGRLDVLYSTPDIGSSRLFEFIRTNASYINYLELGSPRLVWANGLWGGYVKNLSDLDGSGVPTSYAFFLGGQSTVRGFSRSSNNERIPNNTVFPITSGNQPVVFDDSTYYLFKSELRFPFSGELGGVVFYDGGAVFVTGVDFPKPYRDAAGFGIRVNTPVGPISIDLGFKLNPQENESKMQLHFAIGTF